MLWALSPVPAQVSASSPQLLQGLAANPSQLPPSLETCPPPGSSLTWEVTTILHPHRHRLLRAAAFAWILGQWLTPGRRGVGLGVGVGKGRA